MPRRPPPDRIDDIGFTCREVGELIGRSAERVRQLCVAAPGFGVLAPDGMWRVPPINALAALAIQLQLKGHRGISAAEFVRRTQNGANSLRAIGQAIADTPELQAQLCGALETKLAGWWQRHRRQPPPSPIEVPYQGAKNPCEGAIDEDRSHAADEVCRLDAVRRRA